MFERRDATGEGPGAAADRETHGRWFALMLATGSLLCGLSLALDLTPDRQRAAGLLSTAVSLVCAGLVFAGRRRLAPTFYAYYAAPAVVLQLALGIHTSGDPTNPLATFFVAAAAYSGFFFSRRVLLVHLGLAAPAYAIALLSLVEVPAALDRWMFTVGMAALTGWVVATLRDRLVSQARTDWLTRVGNRRAFHEALGRELDASHRARIPLAIAVLDVDGFKALNDSRGHAAGDRALTEIAAVLRDGARPGCVARLGGDEFGVVLPGADAQAARRWATRTRRALAAHGLPVTASLGTAATDPSSGAPHATDPDALLRAADASLYRDKGGEGTRNPLMVGA